MCYGVYEYFLGLALRLYLKNGVNKALWIKGLKILYFFADADVLQRQLHRIAYAYDNAALCCAVELG